MWSQLLEGRLMTEVAEQYMVRFDGAGAGEAELSWGQKENWATIAATGSWLPLGGVKWEGMLDSTCVSLTEAESVARAMESLARAAVDH